MLALTSAPFAGWLLLLLAVVLLNAMPAFMPPTWVLLAYFHVEHGFPLVPLALVGAAGAMSGRFILAEVSRQLGPHVFPQRWLANIAHLSGVIQSHKTLSIPTLGLFALGPIPTNHLFIAAGVSAVPLPPLLLVFGVTRFVSYLVWVSAVNTAVTSIDDALRPGWGEGVTVAAQILGFILLIVVMQVDWWGIAQRWRRGPDSDSTP